MESPYLYDRAISAQNYLIIPFQYGQVSGYPIYSYALLSAFGHRGAFHQATNPANLFSSSMQGILDIAQEHLAKTLLFVSLDEPPNRVSGSPHAAPKYPDQNPLLSKACYPLRQDPFRQRYIYQGHLLIIGELRGQYFYDHYAPHTLLNIAAPKFFTSESECLSWIKLSIHR